VNICLVSPAWRRFDVTRFVLAQRRWLCDELASRGHQATGIVVADDENLDIAAEYGFDTVEAPNDDLGRRFNDGYQRAGELGADVLVHIGSDDWVHPDAFNILDEVDPNADPELKFDGSVVRNSPVCIAQRNITLVNLPTNELQRCNVAGDYGCPPWLIPRRAMEPIGFRPIAEIGMMRGIDGLLVRGLTTRPNWLRRLVPPEWCVDFKSDVNVTHYAGLKAKLGTGPAVEPWPALAEHYPQHLVDMARGICEGGDGSWTGS